MNVTLVAMTEQEFDNFFELSIEDYAKEHVKSGNWEEEESIEKSRNEYNQLLPQGLETPGQYLMTIIDASNDINLGYLWFNIREQSKNKAFIFNIIIFEQFRGKGYGKLAMTALEDEVKKYGVNEIALHVFGHNETAIELYKKLGYGVTNLKMSKQL